MYVLLDADHEMFKSMSLQDSPGPRSTQSIPVVVDSSTSPRSVLLGTYPSSTFPTNRTHIPIPHTRYRGDWSLIFSVTVPHHSPLNPSVHRSRHLPHRIRSHRYIHDMEEDMVNPRSRAIRRDADVSLRAAPRLRFRVLHVSPPTHLSSLPLTSLLSHSPPPKTPPASSYA